MDSEDSRDGGDAHSSSSSSSSSFRSRRSSSSGSERSKKGPKSPPLSPRLPRSRGPRSPSPESRSSHSPSDPIRKPPQTPDHLNDAHSDINSPETSMPATSNEHKSPNDPKSTSDDGNIASPDHMEEFSSVPPKGGEGPKTPQSPASPKSPPGSPENRSRPGSEIRSRAGSENRSRPASPDTDSPSRKEGRQSRSVSRSPGRNSSPSPNRSLDNKIADWSPKDKWRRHTKGAQKMVDVPSRGRARSRSESSQSSRGSYNKRTSKDTAAQDISEGMFNRKQSSRYNPLVKSHLLFMVKLYHLYLGEMESDQEDRKPRTKPVSKQGAKDLKLSHEDLSDVSDLDSVGQDDTEKESKVHIKTFLKLGCL